MDGDTSLILAAYINWQIGRHPTQQGPLQIALTRLTDQLFELQDIRQFKEQDWIRWGIPIGLGMRLSREVKVFRKQYRPQTRLEAQPQRGWTSLDDLAAIALANNIEEEEETEGDSEEADEEHENEEKYT